MCSAASIALLAGCPATTVSSIWLQKGDSISVDHYYTHAMSADEKGPILGVAFSNPELKKQYIAEEQITEQTEYSAGENLLALYRTQNLKLVPFSGRDTPQQYLNGELNVTQQFTAFASHTNAFGSYNASIVNGVTGTSGIDGRLHSQAIIGEELYDLSAGTENIWPDFTDPTVTYVYGAKEFKLQKINLSKLTETENPSNAWEAVTVLDANADSVDNISDVKLISSGETLFSFWIKSGKIEGASGPLLTQSITSPGNAISIDVSIIENTLYILALEAEKATLYSKGVESSSWDSTELPAKSYSAGIMASGRKSPVLLLLDSEGQVSVFSGKDYLNTAVVAENFNTISAVIYNTRCWISAFVPDTSTTDITDDGEIVVYSATIF